MVTGVGAMPILDVADVERAHDFYRDVVGMTDTQVWHHEGVASFAIVALGKTPLGLRRKQTDRDSRNEDWAAYLYVDDAESHYNRLTEAGAEIVHPLDTAFYGCLEFTIRDPDGHLVTFGQDLESHPRSS